MDIKILLLICYNAVSFSESYYAPPESLHHSVVSQLQNGNRRLDSVIDNEDTDQLCCFDKDTVSSSLEEQLDPDNNSLQRLVVYMYLNVLSDQAHLYIPNREKQSHFPSLNYEQGDVLQNLTDKGILKNNTNIAILINNTSTQPLIDDISNITSTDINASSNNSLSKILLESPTRKNLQSCDLLNAYNSEQKPVTSEPTDKPNLFQTSCSNSRSNTNKNSLLDSSADYIQTPSKSPLTYNDPEYETAPFDPTSLKREEKPRPPTIGFNQVPYIKAQVSEPKLNLSQIVPDKNNIVHITRSNQGRKSVLQPYGWVLPDNSGNEVAVEMITVPINLVRVPQNYNTISVDKSSIYPPSLISAPQSYSKVGVSPVNLKAVPDMIRVHPNSPIQSPGNFRVDSDMIQVPPNRPNIAGTPKNLGVKPNVIQVPQKIPNLVSSPDNLEVDPYVNQVTPSRPNLVGTPDILRVDPKVIKVHQNLPSLVSSPDNLEVDPYVNQVPPSRPNLAGTPDILRVDPNVIKVPQNLPSLVNSPDNVQVDPYMNQVSPTRPNLIRITDDLPIDYNIIEVPLNNLRLEPYMMRIPQKQPQLLRGSNLFSNWFYNQIATANQGLDIQINIETLKRDIIRTLARYNMHISEDGRLTDAQGNVISWDHLQLRAILVGEPVNYESVINSPDPLDFEPSSTYWKALLTTFGPSSETVILDIIPLGKIQRLEKSDLCKPGDREAVVADQVGNNEMLAKLQNHMQLQTQQNIEQVLNRRKLGLKLGPRKKPLPIYDNYKAYKGEEQLKKKKEDLTTSGRREKDYIPRGAPTMRPRTHNNKRVYDVVDWRIIGGAAATSSGAPISVRGRSGYIF